MTDKNIPQSQQVFLAIKNDIHDISEVVNNRYVSKVNLYNRLVRLEEELEQSEYARTHEVEYDQCKNSITKMKGVLHAEINKSK